MKTLLLISILLLGASCAQYSHTRTALDGTKETTSVASLFMTSKASKITSYVKDRDYSRRVGVGSIEGQGDTAFLQALYEAGVASGRRSIANEQQ